MRSSFKENFYGGFFRSISEIYKPDLVVELGVLDGFSLLNLAKGRAKKVIGIDLFERYEFKHGSMEEIYDDALCQGLDNIELRQADAFEAYKDFEDNSIDILHIDISNDGETLETIFDLWAQKVKKDTGLIIFEGGSEERDNVEWMVKYHKDQINDFKYKLKRNWEFVTLTPFPSLTLCRRLK